MPNFSSVSGRRASKPVLFMPAILTWATRTKAVFAEMAVTSSWVLTRRAEQSVLWRYPGVSIEFTQPSDAALVTVSGDVAKTALVYLACWGPSEAGIPELKRGAFGSIDSNGVAICRLGLSQPSDFQMCVVMVVGFDSPLGQRLLDKTAESISMAGTVSEIDGWLTWLDSACRLKLIPREFATRGADVLVKRRALKQIAELVENTKPRNDEARFAAFLQGCNAIERVGLVKLANGHTAAVSIQTSRLCDSEASLISTAQFVDRATRWLDFDTIVTTGWQTATIARRLRSMQPFNLNGSIEVVELEGNPPLCLRGIRPRSRVLVFTDVIVTGSLVAQVGRLVQAAGGRVIDTLTLVGCSDTVSAGPKYRALCRIDLGLSKLNSGELQKTNIDFNSVAQVRTVRKSLPRTVSQFLEQYPAALELWTYVDAAKAFKKHHPEGDVHYLGFVDVEKLLDHNTIGDRLMEKLVCEIRSRCGSPGVLLVPDRDRAVRIAERLRRRLGVEAAQPIRLVIATEDLGRFEIHTSDKQALDGANVLIVDSAMSHGATTDELILCAKAANARSISVSVLLSRLSESHEESLRRRLDGRLAFLYSVPIRPIVVPEEQRWLCPVCKENDDIRRAAKATGATALVELDHIRHAGRRPPKTTKPQGAPQPLLVEKGLLDVCKPATALGIILHAEHTAQNNGMAPLSVKDITGGKFPAATKAAMVSAIANGLLKPPKEVIDELRSEVMCLPLDQAWLATCECLGRSGDLSWLMSLETRLSSGEDTSYLKERHPWRRIAFATFRGVTTKGAGIRECALALTRARNSVDDLDLRDGVDLVIATLQKMEINHCV